MFYDKLEQACREKGISILQLRKTLGIPQATVVSWRSKQLTPRHETLVKIAHYLDVAPESLLENRCMIFDSLQTKCCLCGAMCDGTQTSLSLCNNCYQKVLASVEFVNETLVSLTKVSNILNKG